MKIFVSSLITGMEPFRAAARDAVTTLGHTPVMAEDFGAQPNSPQVACLRGLRESAATILMLGGGYGAKQASGLSATHEEYREAKERGPVFAFVQEGAAYEPDQKAFVDEVQGWAAGLFRGGFSTPDQLRTLITRALHDWELSTVAGPVDGSEMLKRASALIPEQRRGFHNQRGYAVVLAIAPGPRQAILRPSELEKPAFQEEILQAALFGPQRIFTPAKSTQVRIEDHALILNHDDGRGVVRLDSEGNLMLRLPLQSAEHGMIVVEENVVNCLGAALRYAGWVFERIDPTQRLTHVAPVSALDGGEMLVWRTQAEQSASPNSYTMGMGRSEHLPVSLQPGHRPRPALTHQADQLVEDLVTLLRRDWRS